jgi:hypothetical protein
MNLEPRYIAAVILYQIQNCLGLLDSHYLLVLFSFTAVSAIDVTAYPRPMFPCYHGLWKSPLKCLIGLSGRCLSFSFMLLVLSHQLLHAVT